MHVQISRCEFHLPCCPSALRLRSPAIMKTEDAAHFNYDGFHGHGHGNGHTGTCGAWRVAHAGVVIEKNSHWPRTSACQAHWALFEIGLQCMMHNHCTMRILNTSHQKKKKEGAIRSNSHTPIFLFFCVFVFFCSIFSLWS